MLYLAFIFLFFLSDKQTDKQKNKRQGKRNLLGGGLLATLRKTAHHIFAKILPEVCL